MFSKVALLVCLCATSSFAGVSRTRFVREQPNPDEDIILTHKPLTTLPVSLLKVNCLDGGQVEIELATTNIAPKSYIVIGSPAGNPACKSADFAFPLADGQSAKIATTTAVNCGRELNEATKQYKWNVEVNEKITTNHISGISRDFKSTAEVYCEQKPTDTNPIDAPQGVDPVLEGPAEFTQGIDFTIEKTDDLIDGKWEFTLKPAVDGSLAELDFKLSSCVAKPVATDETGPVPPEVVASIIAASCIEDIGTTVDETQSPTFQLIHVYPFQFTGFVEADVQLICTVELCKDSTEPEAAKCAKIDVCAAPERARSASAFQQVIARPAAPISRRVAHTPKRAVKTKFNAKTTF